MSQVFVSYAREDKEFVDRLVRDLEAEKFDVWVDRDDIQAGEGWVAAISQAIEACSFFVIVISSSSSGSKTVTRELILADAYDKQIYPLVLQTCEPSRDIKLLLASSQWVDFEGGYDEGKQKLLAALSRKPPPRPQPGPAADADADYDSPDVGLPPPPPPPRPELTQVLPGQWSVTVNLPMMPPIILTVWLGPDGSFQVQQPTGATAQGSWGVNFGSQLVMQGVETFGMMSRPFYMQVNVSQFGPHYVNGFGPRGEPLYWRRF